MIETPALPASDTITVPRALILDKTINGEPLTTLLHLLACPTCWTVHALYDHGFNRTTAKKSLDTLTRAGYYRRSTVETGDDTLVTIELATTPGEFAPPVCISRVFFAARNGLVKIDATIILPQKLSELEREGGPVELIGTLQGGPGRRDKIHNALRAMDAGDRWFRDGEALRAYLAAVTE